MREGFNKLNGQVKLHRRFYVPLAMANINIFADMPMTVKLYVSSVVVNNEVMFLPCSLTLPKRYIWKENYHLILRMHVSNQNP